MQGKAHRDEDEEVMSLDDLDKVAFSMLKGTCKAHNFEIQDFN